MKNLFILFAFLSIGTFGHAQFVKVVNYTGINLDVGAQAAKMDPTACPTSWTSYTATLPAALGSSYTFMFAPWENATRVGVANGLNSGYLANAFWLPSPSCIPSAPAPFIFNWVSVTEVHVYI